jgi:aconitate hydratase
MAAMRDVANRLNIDPMKINPNIPVELIIDHSVQVDSFGSAISFEYNVKKEFERNSERYAFLRWGQKNFKHFNVVPPATGIIHQVNLEYLARVIFIKTENGQRIAFPDSLVGLDSHTTMINGIGVFGWGVGGIEAEAVMLGNPYFMLTPRVVGCYLTNRLPDGATATDLVLTITELLRKKGVVGKFVEFYGPGVNSLSCEDRATISNMAPEYGATMGFFPVDDETIKYLRLSGRTQKSVALVENYCKAQGLFRTETTPDPIYIDSVCLDISTIEPSLAGPSRPQQRIPLLKMKKSFKKLFTTPNFQNLQTNESAEISIDGNTFSISHGCVVIAAITSCTNTSNPSVMVGAGLLAKKAVERGLCVKPWVKTSLAPGSKVVTEYLKIAGLMQYLDALRFNLVAYGCASCIGNSGPLLESVASAIREHNLVAVSVISGNRNFEGRVSPLTRANFLASPPLVVAYAIAGRVDIDFEKEPISLDSSGKPVYLREIWPGAEEIRKVIKEPPFFKKITLNASKLQDIKGARVLAFLGDSVTTDHISPAGAIPADGPAGAYLIKQGVTLLDFNSFGSRRGNHEVMLRGAFGNIHLQNRLVPGIEGGWTICLPEGKKMSIYEAAMQYQKQGTPLLIMAGSDYGIGSSRDWAAKGTALLGVKAVIAESFERIHRSNLVCMGVLPLQFKPGENPESLELDGTELYNITGIKNKLRPGKELLVCANRKDDKKIEFTLIVRIDSPVELSYYKHGGILAYVLRRLKKE